jgi:ferredoxin
MHLVPTPLGVFLDEPQPGGDHEVTIRVDIDRNHCHRFAICEQEAPEVFRLRADGRLEYRSRPGVEHRDAVRQAARVCPMQAITIEERRR